MSEFLTEAEKAEIERLTVIIKASVKERRKIKMRQYQRRFKGRHA